MKIRQFCEILSYHCNVLRAELQQQRQQRYQFSLKLTHDEFIVIYFNGTATVLSITITE